MEVYKYMVRVSCMTYNHAPYIKDAMDGFCMQETNFPFVCTIMDDASTDGEQEVIKNYLKAHFDLEDSSVVRNEETDDYYLIFARHTTNKNCFFAVLLLKYNHYSIKKPKMSYLLKEWRDTKYVAICEGDDYWIDREKLQLQFNYLETHHDCGLVRMNIDKLILKNGNVVHSLFSTPPYSNIKDTHDDYLIHGFFLAPCTWMFRVELSNSIHRLNPNTFFTGDLNIALAISKEKEVCFINKVVAVYREAENSASHFTSYADLFEFKQKMKNTRIYYALQRPIGVRIKTGYKMCRQRIPPFKEWKYFPRWIIVCFDIFFKLFGILKLKA